MTRSRFTEGQIIGLLQEAQACAKTAEPSRKHGISGKRGLQVALRGCGLIG